MAKVTAQPLKVIARAPFQVYYEGEAEVVSAVNQVGPFDILPGHAPFFSVIDPGEVKIQTSTELISVPVTNGIICVRNGEVLLFLNL